MILLKLKEIISYHEERSDVIIALKVFKGPGDFLTIIKDNVGVFAKKIAGEEGIDDASTLPNSDVHVIGLFAEPVQVVSALRIFRFPRRLLRQPILLLLLLLPLTLVAAPNTELSLSRSLGIPNP